MSKLELDYVDNLEKLFNFNNKLKQAMIDASPKEIYFQSDEGLIEYQDIIFDFLRSCAFYFDEMSKIIEIDSNIALNKIYAMMKKLNDMHISKRELLTFYRDNISDMDKDVLAKISGMLSNISAPNFSNKLMACKTINELTNAYHTYMLNVWDKKKEYRVIAKKTNCNNQSITLSGVESEVGDELFMGFPLELECGPANIISFSKDRFAITIRDIGHALTLDITIINNKAYVKYFIPKITMKDKVTSLPGIINISDEFASGNFICSKDDLVCTVMDFIKEASLTDIENKVNYGSR